MNEEGIIIKTIGELKKALENIPDDTSFYATDGDRVFDVNIFKGNVKGQDHPGKKWDVTGVFVEIY